jgi:hypothetical protein
MLGALEPADISRLDTLVAHAVRCSDIQVRTDTSGANISGSFPAPS